MARSSRKPIPQSTFSLLTRLGTTFATVVIILSVVIIVFLPGIAGAYLADIIFWGLLVVLIYLIFFIVGLMNYQYIIRSKNRESESHSRRAVLKRAIVKNRIAVVWAEGIIVTLLLCHVWLHITNPYAKFDVVEQPYTTTVNNDGITVKKQFGLHAANGPLAETLGYYKSGFLIVQNAWFGSYPAASKNAEAIIGDIHKLRFDPSKPYLISGDQFSVLYPRNLGVFYNSLLDYRTAHSQQDWENRQRIYMQSALYALDAFSSAKHITTTIVPVSPRTVALTQVHPGSVASDSLYGVLYAFERLKNAEKVQTTEATKSIIHDRKDDLKMLIEMYVKDVQDPSTGLIKRGSHLASARDGVLRDSSFYDNIVLWKTLDLADKLDIRLAAKGELDMLRAKIIKTFWQEDKGYFKDDQKTTDYSSDWLLALPTGFLSLNSNEDRIKLERIIHYTKDQRLDQPFPIRYTAVSGQTKMPWAVKKFVPNYGGDAIWSYWGAQYIHLLAAMYHQTGSDIYKADAEKFIGIYNDKIEQTRGFPETFDTEGNFLQNMVYKSIRQTGWVVQFEQAKAELKESQ